jgi:hypothetical protein
MHQQKCDPAWHSTFCSIEADHSVPVPTGLRLSLIATLNDQIMLRLFTFLLLFCCNPGFTSEAADTDLDEQARQIAQRFIGELKPQLKQAMTEGGPILAIEVCASAAPKIADKLSADSGWLVKRVSLKSRNASRAQPDNWERAVLMQFDERQAAGEEASALHHAGIKGNWYRYMQAQSVEPLCLVCHGMNLSEPVQAELNDFYPDDWATGYHLGEVRGAISLAKQLQPKDQAEETR